MLRAAARRFSLILLGLVAGIGIPCVLIGLAAGIDVRRTTSLGFYIVGAVLLTGTVVTGIRGPLRPEFPSEPGPGRLFQPRLIRKATAEERWTAQRSAVLLFTLGMILIVLGTVVDPVHRNV